MIQTVADAEARVSPPRPRWRAAALRVSRLSGDQRALASFGASRVLVFLISAYVSVTSRTDPGLGPWPSFDSGGGWLRGLARWDGAWYLAIARGGYQTTGAGLHGGPRTLAFFPLYPLVVRAVATVTHAPAVACGLQVSLAFGALAAVLVHRLADRLAGPAAADRAVLLFCFFPAAFILSMTYAESLFIAAACGALLALLDRRWVTAGVLTALAGLTRATGVALVAACAATAAVAVLRDRDRRSVLAPLIGLLGPLSYGAFVWSVNGDPRGWLAVEQRYWGDRASLGMGTATHLVALAHSPGWSLEPGALNLWMAALGLAVGLVAVGALVRARLPLAVSVFGIGAFVFAMCSAKVGPRPRMLLAAFPLILAVAFEVRGRRFRWLLGASAAAMAAMTLMSLTTLAAFP